MAADLHRNPPFRAEHLGSLLRPHGLLETREAVEKGKASKQQLASAEDKAVRQIVDLQLKLGYHAVSDGEYRRHNGFETVKNPDVDLFRPYMPDISAFLEAGHGPVDSVFCVGKIKHVDSTYVDQWNFLKSLVPEERLGECKLTLAAPNWYHMRYKEGNAYPESIYSSDEEYFADIAKAYQIELQILYDHGLRNVQFDDPNLA
ncbi:MAG: hypothetical protein Q9214_004930, partial [Letrouitia sp. 1 TL-2023]